MEQNVQPIEAPVASKKEKSGSGMKVFAVAMTILAIAGIGFGVYGMIKSQKSLENSVADLKVQVKNSDGTTTTIETDKIEITDDNKTAVISDPVIKANSKNYIYVPDWGLKIKIPEEIHLVAYEFTYTYPEDFSEFTSELSVTANFKDSQQEFNDYNVLIRDCSSGLGTVGRMETSYYEKEWKDTPPRAFNFMTRDGYTYYFEGPQNTCSSDVKNEVRMAGTIKKMLTNPENYSEM